MNGDKRPRVPVILQMEAQECGAASLAMILAYHGCWTPLETLRARMGVGRDGSNARALLAAARDYGLDCAGYRYDAAKLRENAIFPCILYWRGRHFLVLRGFWRGRAHLTDPAFGEISLSMEDFERSYAGVCLQFEKTAAFEVRGAPRSAPRYARETLRGFGGACGYIAIASLLLTVAGVYLARLGRAFVDQILPSGAHFDLLLGAIAALMLLILLLMTLRRICVARASGLLEARGSTRFFAHLTRLPMTFFAQRMAGDLLSRLGAQRTIADTLMGALIPGALAALSALFCLITMARIAPPLALICLGAALCILLAARFASRGRLEAARLRQRDAGRLTAETMGGLRLIETLKATGSEAGWFARWAGYQASLGRAQSAHQRALDVLPKSLVYLAGALVFGVGAGFMRRGAFTAGSLLLAQGLTFGCLLPIRRFAGADDGAQRMRADMERTFDVLRYPEDGALTSGADLPADAGKLAGAISLRHVSFGYGAPDAPVIEDCSLDVAPGARVALVGGSGSGKSTIAKLIAGLYQPWSGEILYDGKPLNEIPRALITSSIAVVDQEITLFRDTVANNIRLWDRTIEDFEIVLAARDACVHDDIMTRAGGYDHVMLEDGRDFSGGQRQRLEIARVLAMDPTVLILDEATSALDAETEKAVSDAVSARGVTQIIIAHRLSTIRDCDEIVVLDAGRIAEHGTHETLMALDGLYARLVRLA